MTKNELKVGDMLVAIDECKMDENEENALIIGKSYVGNLLLIKKLK